ncbi:GntR family transcriptional regulator, partial [bacterium]|nr:GntR family transcriptional regulator [bacterium]
MDLRIDKDGDVPIYEQIRSQIEWLVRDGLLPPGRKIISVRQLSRQLGVGKNTVSRAYDELAAESIIETRHGSGTYIPARPDIATGENLRTREDVPGEGEDISRMRWEPYSFKSEFFGLPLSKHSHEMIRFTQASPDPELFPFERIKQVATNMLGYPK